MHIKTVCGIRGFKCNNTKWPLCREEIQQTKSLVWECGQLFLLFIDLNFNRFLGRLFIYQNKCAWINFKSNFQVLWKYWLHEPQLKSLCQVFKTPITTCNERLFKTNFSPQKQAIIHYKRYVFETSKLTLFLGLTLLYLDPKFPLHNQYLNKVFA